MGGQPAGPTIGSRSADTAGNRSEMAAGWGWQPHRRQPRLASRAGLTMASPGGEAGCRRARWRWVA